MAATPEQWVSAIQTSMGQLQAALTIAEALVRNKVTFVGLPQGDERYLSDPSPRQIADTNRDLLAAVSSAVQTLRDTKDL